MGDVEGSGECEFYRWRSGPKDWTWEIERWELPWGCAWWAQHLEAARRNTRCKNWLCGEKGRVEATEMWGRGEVGEALLAWIEVM